MVKIIKPGSKEYLTSLAELNKFISDKGFESIPRSIMPPNPSRFTLGTAVFDFLVCHGKTALPLPTYLRHEASHVISGFGILGDEPCALLFDYVLNRGNPNVTTGSEGSVVFPSGDKVPSLESLISEIGGLVGTLRITRSHELMAEVFEEFTDHYNLRESPGVMAVLMMLMLGDEQAQEQARGMLENTLSPLVSSTGVRVRKEDKEIMDDPRSFREIIKKKAEKRSKDEIKLPSIEQFTAIYISAVMVEGVLNKILGKPYSKLTHDELAHLPGDMICEARGAFLKGIEGHINHGYLVGKDYDPLRFIERERGPSR